jgi:hypothetical protein
MRYLIRVVILTFLMGLFPSSIALADDAKPIRQDVSAPFQFTLENVCSFPVEITSLANKEVLTIYSDGRRTVTGQLKVRLTNVTTGQSIDANISGPVTFTPTSDGFTAVFRGRSLIFPNGTDLLFISSGRTIMTISPDMTFFTLLSVTGSTFDVCAALA